ncbi:hypothetical protein FOL47_007903 [Perkinsus chesapeaki]|uniref:Uncharacterized protein n=1 Tax=Perkinsus chesapeaki TaxID=330153 RepID=A0A7J6LHG5_PERCH|nr:hypothetical protein FOL47_007903 [Perkinsus chesapeaki]
MPPPPTTTTATTIIPEVVVRDPLARNSDMIFILIVLVVGMLFIVPILRFTPDGVREPVTAPRKSKSSRDRRPSGPVMAAVVGVMKDIAAGFDPSGTYSRQVEVESQGKTAEQEYVVQRVSSEPDSESYELQEPMTRSPSPTSSMRACAYDGDAAQVTTRRKVSPVEMVDLLSGN